MRLPELVAHADWSANSPGRQIAIARRVGPRYTASAVRPVGTLGDLVPELLAEAGANGTALLGVDFPIGLPRAYAVKAGIADFRVALKKFGRGRWRSFYEPAATSAEIALTRPFYPARPGPKGVHRRDHLPAALGIRSYDDLHRKCDLGHPDRSAAAVLFWTLGANQWARPRSPAGATSSRLLCGARKIGVDKYDCGRSTVPWRISSNSRAW